MRGARAYSLSRDKPLGKDCLSHTTISDDDDFAILCLVATARERLRRCAGAATQERVPGLGFGNG